MQIEYAVSHVSAGFGRAPFRSVDINTENKPNNLRKHKTNTRSRQPPKTFIFFFLALDAVSVWRNGIVRQYGDYVQNIYEQSKNQVSAQTCSDLQSTPMHTIQ